MMDEHLNTEHEPASNPGKAFTAETFSSPSRNAATESLISLLFSEYEPQVVLALLKAAETVDIANASRDLQAGLLYAVSGKLGHLNSEVRSHALRALTNVSGNISPALLLFAQKEREPAAEIKSEAIELLSHCTLQLRGHYENTFQRIRHFTAYAKKADARSVAEDKQIDRETLDELSLMMLRDPDPALRREMAYLLCRQARHLEQENQGLLLLYTVYGLQEIDTPADVKRAMLYILDEAGPKAGQAMPIIQRLFGAEDRALAASAAATALRIVKGHEEASQTLLGCVHAGTYFKFSALPAAARDLDLEMVDQLFEPYYRIIYTLTDDPAGVSTDTSELDDVKDKVKDAFSLIQDAYEKALADLPAQFEGTARLLNEAWREQVLTRLAWQLPDLHENYYEEARTVLLRTLLDPHEPDSVRRSLLRFIRMRPEDSDRLVDVFLQVAINTHQDPSVRSVACDMLIFIGAVTPAAASKARTILTWLANEDQSPEVRESASDSVERMQLFSRWRDETSSQLHATALRQDARGRMQEIEKVINALKSDLDTWVKSLNQKRDD